MPKLADEPENPIHKLSADFAPGYRLEVPHLIRIEPIRFPLFVIDFNGPAMASDAGDPPGLPLQLVTNEVSGRIRPG